MISSANLTVNQTTPTRDFKVSINDGDVTCTYRLYMIKMNYKFDEMKRIYELKNTPLKGTVKFVKYSNFE